MKIILIFCTLFSSFTAGIVQKIPFDHAVKKIDLLLEEEEIAFVFLPLKSGEATLVKNAEGKTLLVNTGGPHTRRQLKAWLRRFRVEAIDAVLLTNSKKSYTANLSWLIPAYHVQKVFCGTRNSSAPTTVWKKGARYELLPGLFVNVLCKSNNSFTLSFQYGKLQVLYMASGEQMIEKQLMQMPLKDVDILKIADFASKNRPSFSFLKAIDPQAAIIFREEGTLPNQRLLERLYQLWIDIYQTEQTGAVTVKCDPLRYKIITF